MKVKELEKLINEYDSLLIATYTGFTSNYFKETRRRLKGKARIKVSKNTLLQVALSKVKPNYKEKLSEYMHGQNVFFFTNLHPTKLYSYLKEKPMSMPVKAGEIATEDISVPEGITDLTPGPIMTKLSDLGVKTKIQGGKIYVLEEKVIVRKGEKVSKNAADVLAALGIKPVKAVFKVKAAIDREGVIYPPEAVEITPDLLKKKILEVFKENLTLAVSQGIPTKYSAPILVFQAYLKSLNLSVQLSIPTKNNAPFIIMKAFAIAKELARNIPRKE